MTAFPASLGAWPRRLRAPGWLLGLAAGAMLTLAPGLALAAATLLAPGWVALALDRAPGRPAARAALLFGACGAAGPVVHSVGPEAPGVRLAASVSAETIVVAWLAAAAGWLLRELAPVLACAASDALEARRAARLRRLRERLTAEWETRPEAPPPDHAKGEPLGP